MTREDIIKMAREAGAHDNGHEVCFVEPRDFYRFIALVEYAQQERMTVNSIHSCHDECDRPGCVAVRKAVEAEREACAEICDAEATIEGIAQRCAAAIRARGSK